MKKMLFSSFGPAGFLLLLIAAVVGSGAVNASATDPLEQFTGTHTRVAWIQEQGTGADTFALGNNFKLLGYDSRDGKKERILLDETGNLYKPIFTPDGSKVVVSDRLQHKVYLVDFNNGRKKDLGKGVAVDVWPDPATSVTWVYVLAGDGPENQYFTTHPLIRFPLDNPGKREPVWDKTHLSWSNFDLSRDGKFAGGLFPWPHAGILLFEKNTWKQYGKGCWTALSPDNSAILWVFDGLHRNLNFVNPFTAKFWTTNINNAPGINGFEVYHPRWTNHVRYLTMTGPYVEGEGGNKITGGGTKVEIYVGRFSPDLKSVEGWLQVTDNDKADFYPDVWLANGSESNFSKEPTGIIPLTGSDQDLSWPGSRKRLVFLWQDVLAENKLGDNSLLGFSQFRVTPKQRARFNRFLEMDLYHAGFTADWPVAKALPVLQNKNGAGIEFLFTPETVSGAAVGPVLRIQGEMGEPYLALSQKGNDLELAVTGSGKSVSTLAMKDVLQPHQPLHVFVNIAPSRVQVYFNGSLNNELAVQDTPLAAWKNDARLLFGRPESGDPGINGALSHVALFAGTTTAQEITRSAQLVTGALEERPGVPALSFKGALVEASKVPAPEDLGAYQRALVVNRYRVVKLLQGKYTAQEILVAQWAVLDRTVLPETAEFVKGYTTKLQVEPFDQHPELEGERLMMDMFDPDLEIYYQVNSE